MPVPRHRWLTHLLLALLLPATAALAQSPPAFPGAEGHGAVASGGRGGAVYAVTTLAADPAGIQPGSLNHALAQSGPRTIVFRVSGVIHAFANVRHGDVTIAGQTSPGGVIVRGLLCDGHYEQNDCGNLIVRHLRLRPAWNLPIPGGQGCVDDYDACLDDGLRLDGIDTFIFDHVSIAGATDEAVQLSWAADGTIQRSILAETVGDHADRGGMLLNYSHPALPQNRLSVLKNLWYRIGGRLPEITCEASGYDGDPPSVADCQAHALQLEVSDNYYHDPGFLVWYNRDVDQNPADGPYRVELNYVGNHMQARASFPYGMVLHDLLDVASNSLYVQGNHLNLYPALADYQLFYCCNDFPGNAPNTDLGVATRRTGRHPFASVAYFAGDDWSGNLLHNVGALPADPMDRRFRASALSGTISPVDWGTPLANDAFDLDFPPASPPPAPADSDGDGMPDAWESAHGLNPNNAADRNGGTLSLPLTGIAGYTNLEVYINLLADARADERIFRNGFDPT